MNITRYVQYAGECAAASVASICHYYDTEVDYSSVRRALIKSGYNLSSGLFPSSMGSVLNILGFRSVTIYTCDLSTFDFTWNALNKDQISSMREKMVSKSRSIGREERNYLRATIDFLKNENNKFIIDYKFGKVLRGWIDKGLPVLIGFNWTKFFRQPKSNYKFRPNPVLGKEDYHSVVARGYDRNGVQVVDSCSEEYKGNLSKYRKGYYVMPWEDFCVVVSTGELVVPMGYSRNDLLTEEIGKSDMI